jgi:hypothetical protein
MIAKARLVTLPKVGLLLLLSAVVALAYQALAAPADSEHQPPQRVLNIKPQPIATDKTVKYDYDIVYVRAPRTVTGKDGKERPAQVWPEIGHPYNLQASTDLMLLHPDGSEEILVAGGKGAIADPYVSFDAQWVYYTLYHEVSADPYRLNAKGTDIYKVNVKTHKTVRLTHQQWTPNTGVADWSADYRTPEKGKTTLSYGVANMHPCPLPGGRVAFVSNRDGFKTPKGYPQQALQLFVMDDDGQNVHKIGHLNIGCALHPVVLKDGRIIFSTLESQGIHTNIIWGIWSIHPDGTNWAPVVSALFQGGAADAFHFQSQLSDGSIVVERYYNQNTLGFGTYYTIPPAAPEGVPGFGPAKAGPDAQTNVLREGRAGPEAMRFRPYGMKALTRFTHGSDSAAPPSDPTDPKSPRMGKVQHPCGAPDNHLLTIWSPGATNNANGPSREPVHAGIYLIKSGTPIWEPGAMLLIKHDPNFNAQWPRPLVPYQRIYGVEEPVRLPDLPNNGKGAYSRLLPEATPFGLVGTSSLYKRESFPDGTVPVGSVTATGDPMRVFSSEHSHWDAQGSDAGLYANSEIHGIRILAMEPASLPVSGKFVNYAHERLRILGEFPVRKFDSKGSAQPLDPDGNPDTSFLAKIPADVAFTFQMIDKDGMNLTMAQTWHQVRPGEIRNDCGGCHAHSQKPTHFKDTAASKADYPVWNLTEKTPLLTAKKSDESGKKWDTKDEIGVRFVNSVKNVEYWRDIRPILDRSCVACHTQKSKEPAGDLVLDADDQPVDGQFHEWNGVSPANPAHRKPPGTYFRLALDNGQRNSSHHAPLFGKKPAASKNGAYWRYPLASRYITKFQARRSMLIWKVQGRRTDGLPEAWLTDKTKADKLPKELLLDYNPAVMPPPEAVAGTYVGPDGSKIKVAPLTDEDKRTLVRWIDLGCPIDLDYDPAHPEKPGRGWMLDDQRPTLALTSPQAGPNPALDRLLVGMHDYGTGLDLASFEVVADFPVDGIPAGQNLAKKFKALPDYRWELRLSKAVADLPRGKLTVSIKDKQGNTSRIERSFSVGAAKP